MFKFDKTRKRAQINWRAKKSSQNTTTSSFSHVRQKSIFNFLIHLPDVENSGFLSTHTTYVYTCKLGLPRVKPWVFLVLYTVSTYYQTWLCVSLHGKCRGRITTRTPGSGSTWAGPNWRPVLEHQLYCRASLWYYPVLWNHVFTACLNVNSRK